jgi:hypothetical protein
MAKFDVMLLNSWGDDCNKYRIIDNLQNVYSTKSSKGSVGILFSPIGINKIRNYFDQGDRHTMQPFLNFIANSAMLENQSLDLSLAVTAPNLFEPAYMRTTDNADYSMYTKCDTEDTLLHKVEEAVFPYRKYILALLVIVTLVALVFIVHLYVAKATSKINNNVVASTVVVK